MSSVVLYNGLDTNFDAELWETNGTSSGTTEVTPGLEAAQGGINPLYLTLFNGEVLFEGRDSNGPLGGLWVTNGTAAGTFELTGIANANPMGLGPQYMQVYNNEVLFRGQAGVAGDVVPGLWVTDGTAAGTTEIGGPGNIGINNAYAGGLLPGNTDFTVFNGEVLFLGRDTVGNVGLWVTDGTAAGTQEIGNISGAMVVGPPGSFGSDIQPRYMTVLGNEVLFDGADQEDTPGSLWETDGTAAGTIEIGGQGNAGIAGSPNGFTGQFTSELPLGIQPYDLTLFNNKVLFAGYDSTLKSNGFYADTDALWITDGTAGGTVEIGGLGNAGIKFINPAISGGIFWNGSIEYPDFTAYNGVALFVGRDSSGHVGLWETDGTAAGTIEIGGLGNAGIHGGLSLLGSQTPDFTVYNGEVLFNGIDSNGHSGLWVTNGTAAGTIELTTPDFGAPYATLGPDFTSTAPPATTGSLTFTQIDEIYQAILRRTPTTAEVTACTSLDTAIGNAAVIAAIVDSPEAQYNVYPIVQNILLATGNTPTAAQLAGWVPFVESAGLLQGSSQTNPLLDQMAEAFVASSAFGNTYNGGTAVNPNAPITGSIVSAVIQAATGVAATPGQINAWLSTGQTIDQVFVDFALGDQYSAHVQGAVQQYLTTAAGNAAGGNGLGTVNTTPNDHLTTAQVQAAYQAVLERAPTSAESNAALSIDATIGNVAALAAITDSPEAQQHVYPVTQIILLATGNVPTPAQLAGWVPAVETGTSLDTMALAFVASTAFGDTYNGGATVNPNAPITAGIVSAIIDAATGLAATQSQVNAWLATGQTIDQVFVDFSLGDQYSAAIESTVQAYLGATAINAAGLTTVDGVNSGGALILGTSATPLAGNNLTILGGSGPLTVVASGSGDTITELSSSTAAGAITASGNNDIINVATGANTITLTGDLTGATTQNGTATSGIAVTTLGNVATASSEQIIFNNTASEVLAGTTAVNVTAAGSSLAKALDIAAADAAVSQAGGQIAAHTGVITWFQLGGNTYIVEAINATASAAAHPSLTATDEVIKIVGLVDLSGESLSAHTLTL
jgi:ELWxxDGT repeat protein